MNKANIEIEIRAFVTKKEYTRLLKLFKKSSQLVKEDKQETIYFDCEEDLRIQKNNFTSKIWLKGGNLHDDCREEIEIHTDVKNYENLQELFDRLGYKQDIKWIRNRKEIDWEGIKVCLDYTVGYGYIIELEVIGKEENKEEKLKMLRLKLEELGIKETPKEEFNKAYDYYKKNWNILIKNENKN
jgi:predicted adenylyl cyclase CyaB